MCRVRLHINPRAALIVVSLVACLTAGGVMAARVVSTPTLQVSGPASGASIGPLQDGRLVFSAHGSRSLLRRERWSLDGRDVTRLVQLRNGVAIFRPGRLDEGGHEVDVRAGGGFLGASARKQIDFAVDLTPPFLDVPGPFRAAAWHPLAVSGKTDANAHGHGRRPDGHRRPRQVLDLAARAPASGDHDRRHRSGRELDGRPAAADRDPAPPACADPRRPRHRRRLGESRRCGEACSR